MTTADVIERCLAAIRDHFYVGPEGELRSRDFARDRTALMKAICRYGKACADRGWEFDEGHVVQAILQLLPQVTRPQHQWLPLYLEQCIDRHVGQKAEQLNEKAKALRTKAEAAVSRARKVVLPGGVVVRPVSTTEQLATLWHDLNNRRRRKAAQRQAPAPAQPSLL